jgi:hypothetical protein
LLVAGSLAANLMTSVLRIIKQVLEFVFSLKRPKLNLPLKGKISASLGWDFRGER